MYENVLVGIDGRSGDSDAIALAKALAPDAGRFTLSHVRPIDAVRSRGSVGDFDTAKHTLSQELLERERAEFAPDAEVVSVPAVSVGAGIHDVAVQRGADLIVVGSCHRSPAGRFFAGDDTRSVLHHAPCAVAVAPPGWAVGSQRMATIAAAYDGSQEGEVAIAHAALLADALKATLVAHNVEEMHVYGGGGWMSSVLLEDPETIVADARERLGELGAAKVDIVVGPVRQELAALSEQADLLVCGSRHQSGVGRVLHGSTSDYLARHADCALVVTPATDESRVTAWHELRDRAAV